MIVKQILKIGGAHRRAAPITLMLAGSALAPFTAHAQEVPSSAPSAPAAISQAGSDSLQEVIVTAQRREENLQHAAVAVQAFTGNELQSAQVVNLIDLGRLAPAVEIDTLAGAFVSVTMRGVSSSDTNEFGSPAISISEDGMYMPRGTSPVGIFYDIGRVEVLKGPQGTLYGRNTAAGAINIITNSPQLGSDSADIQVTGGNYDLMSATGAINVPFGETVAVRTAFEIVDRGGYFSDGTGDEKHQSARISAKWDPSSDTSLILRGDYVHVGGKGPGGTGWCIGTPTSLALGGYRPDCNPVTGQFWGNPYTSINQQAAAMMANAAQRFPLGAPGLSSGMLLNPPGYSPGVYWPVYTNGGFVPTSFTPVDPISASPYIDNTNWSVSGQFDWNMPAGKLTLIPTFRHEQSNFLANEPGDTLREIDSTTQQTLEARFASDTEHRLQYILGAFYAHDDRPGQPSYDTQGYIVPAPVFQYVAFPQAPTLEAENTDTWGWSAAAFANTTFSLTKSFRLTGGLRFTHDHRGTEDSLNSVNYFVPQNYATTSFPTGPGVTDANGTVLLPGAGAQAFAYPAGGRPDIFTNSGYRNWDKTSWKVGLEADVTSASLVYATLSTGFKSGGFFLAPPSYRNSYEPEDLRAYTLGSKNRFLDNRLQLNLEMFYWDYRNQQINGFQLDGPFLVLATQNASQSTIKGAELESQFALRRGTLLTADVQYTDAYYNKFTYNSVFPNASCIALSATTFNCDGNRLLNAPLWGVTYGIQQTVDLKHGDNLVFYFGGRSESNHPGGLGLSPYQYIPENTRLDANLTYNDPMGRWSIEAWAKNLTNTATPLGAGGGFGASQIFSTLVRPPLTFGASLSAHF